MSVCVCACACVCDMCVHRFIYLCGGLVCVLVCVCQCLFLPPGGGRNGTYASVLSLMRGGTVLAPASLGSRLRDADQPEGQEQINLTNNLPVTARPAELMAEEVAKRMKDSKETVTLCYRNPLNRFLLLPPRVGKVLRAKFTSTCTGKKSRCIRRSPGEGQRAQADQGGEEEGRAWESEREREREREGDRSLAWLTLAYFLMQAKRDWT